MRSIDLAAPRARPLDLVTANDLPVSVVSIAPHVCRSLAFCRPVLLNQLSRWIAGVKTVWPQCPAHTSPDRQTLMVVR
jgi:hypothetical protein